MVRALHYITGRLPVLIQAVCFCPSGESARTLFKSSESKPTISNKQNNSHRDLQNFTQRGPTPLAASVCERIIIQKGHITFYNPRCRLERNETSERIAPRASSIIEIRCMARKGVEIEQRLSRPIISINQDRIFPPGRRSSIRIGPGQSKMKIIKTLKFDA